LLYPPTLLRSAAAGYAKAGEREVPRALPMRLHLLDVVAFFKLKLRCRHKEKP
jgi:hypothetical protein